MSSLRTELREVIAEIGDIDDIESITDTADLYEELGIDSMQGLEIVLEMEKRLGVKVPENKLGVIRSLGDAVRLAKELGASDE